MPSKKYSLSHKSVTKPLMVNEANAESYGREKRQRQRARVGVGLVAVKKQITKPVKRTKSEIAWALEIAGIGAGPADLSEKNREYLRSAT